MRRFARKTQIPVLSLLLLLIAARLALPYVVRLYVNHQLKRVQEFTGHVAGIRIDLYRGAYTIFNLRLVKTNADVTAPFIVSPEMDLSVD